MNGYQSPLKTVNMAELLAKRDHDRGLTPLHIESDKLIQRIKEGGQSGEFLKNAFVSAYRMKPFNGSLGDLRLLDAEAWRLFHGVLHMRSVNGWSDDALYAIEQRILSIPNKP